MNNEMISKSVVSIAPKKNTREILGWILHNVVWIWLIALVVIFGVFNEYFFTIFNLQNIMVQATVLGLLGLAVALPLLIAEIDLSIPANAGFSAAVGAIAYSDWGLPWVIAMLLGLIVGTAIGFFNGWCITRLKMVALIETLAMMIILQGALLALTQGKTLNNFAEGYTWIGQVTIAGWPLMPIVFLLMLIIVGILLKNTVLGRSIYAVGGNPAASLSAGIRVNRVKIMTYTLSGFLAALAGFLLASWQMAITSNQGSSYLLYAIAAPIIGGISVFGGRGNVKGVLGGVLLLTVIQVGLAIVNVPSFYVGMIGGIMIFIAVAIDAIRVRYFG
ncbi:ABC transporter permease [Acinetobacter bereziniae]|jgi:simple sugar transport system permease protein/ribose transport system permease protein|uniref:ABC transporter permease n=1 Tax=Acinetobacter bereziniae TaxID=106648 RepID=UPI001901039F|nr:ABC transporter permease [Acinetobacter bereziniae]MBJ8452136.1 ABC transporter permease [Acinetobacter bereziniae]MBJ8456116.1 ABC transporter permease [Acinetobacter bereziniae]MBJ8552005.1 ABC transporter permease [Acinetobacter bereziniae]MCU4313919.1 ABC transporter permease [Acinetobacter bereziniae]MCV2442605.1 ABC transporter permease [Acinetobacter bereziniae]